MMMHMAVYLQAAELSRNAFKLDAHVCLLLFEGLDLGKDGGKVHGRWRRRSRLLMHSRSSSSRCCRRRQLLVLVLLLLRGCSSSSNSLLRHGDRSSLSSRRRHVCVPLRFHWFCGEQQGTLLNMGSFIASSKSHFGMAFFYHTKNHVLKPGPTRQDHRTASQTTKAFVSDVDLATFRAADPSVSRFTSVLVPQWMSSTRNSLYPDFSTNSLTD